MAQLIPEAAAVLDACLLPVGQDWQTLMAAVQAYRAKMQPAPKLMTPEEAHGLYWKHENESCIAMNGIIAVLNGCHAQVLSCIEAEFKRETDEGGLVSLHFMENVRRLLSPRS